MIPSSQPRSPIQIAVATNRSAGNHGTTVFTALCDDGTLWAAFKRHDEGVAEMKWMRLPRIPPFDKPKES